MGASKTISYPRKQKNYMDLYNYLIAVRLSSFMLQAKQPGPPEATVTAFEVSNLESAS